jgi:hypothetical protein
MKGPLAKRLRLRDVSFAGLAEVGSEHVVSAIMGALRSDDPVAAQIRAETDGAEARVALGGDDDELFLQGLARETAIVEARELRQKAARLAAVEIAHAEQKSALEIAHAEQRAIAETSAAEARSAAVKAECVQAERRAIAETAMVEAECAGKKRAMKAEADAEVAKRRAMKAEADAEMATNKRRIVEENAHAQRIRTETAAELRTAAAEARPLRRSTEAVVPFRSPARVAELVALAYATEDDSYSFMAYRKAGIPDSALPSSKREADEWYLRACAKQWETRERGAYPNEPLYKPTQRGVGGMRPPAHKCLPVYRAFPGCADQKAPAFRPRGA